VTIIDFITFYKVNGGCRTTKTQNLLHLVGKDFQDMLTKAPNLSFCIS